MVKLPKVEDKRKLSRSILGPIVFAICVAAVYAALIFGYTAFEYDSEWKGEQETFEALCANVNYEQQRLSSAAGSANLYSGKYSLAESDIYGIISGFLNKTYLTVPSYTFMWVKSLTFLRMYEHSLMLNDDVDLVFTKPSTKIVNIVFRSALPIFSTFAIGCGVSAIHTIVTNVLKVFIRHKKHEAWTVGRNKLLRIKVICCMIVALIYAGICFIFSSFAVSRWQDVSFEEGIKIVLNLIATIPPEITVKSVTDAHTLAAFNFFLHSAVAYVIFCLVLLIKTWRISAFAIPLITDIDGANEVDKKVQKEYRQKRNNLFNGKNEKVEEVN